jgi:hypothetical protein
MAAILRSETGGKTRQQRFAEVLEQVEAFVGDGDPHLVSGVTIARAVGCSEGQANRARQTIMRNRAMPVVAAKATWPAEPKPKKPAKLFWTIGDRLFCEHRQPQEVECEAGWQKLKPSRVIPIEELIYRKTAVA